MLTVICGSMFSEKSTELLRRGRRLERAGKKVIYIKPDMDTRYSDKEIVTHDGLSVPAYKVDVNNPAELMDLCIDYEVVLIDEIQFFDSFIIKVIKALMMNDITVLVAGLDLDYKAEPFFNTTTLMGYAEEVIKLQAVCTHCGGDAWVSAKVEDDSDSRIELGSEELYFPLCRKCYEIYTY